MRRKISQIKVHQYLDAGAKQVWVLYPKTKMCMCSRQRRISVLKGDEILSGGDLLPGFAVNRQ